MLRTFEIGIYKSSDLIFPSFVFFFSSLRFPHSLSHARALHSFFALLRWEKKWMDPHWDYFGARGLGLGFRVQVAVCIAVIVYYDI